jgi:hypothetical protein
VKKTESK